MTDETTVLPKLRILGLPLRLVFALLCFSLGLVLAGAGCGRREVFETESAAKAALVGKTPREVINRLGAPNSIATAGNVDGPNRRYSESWTYLRSIRDPKTRELKTLKIHFLRNRAVAVEIEK